ncbi:type II toxin-antitoxin system RelE/ParE family toxin [Brevibacterium sp. NPDC049920]|uniref:Type II toxin-antitoxin system RelE/ParE family toxin n=1 Tax=Brevibacterium pityocampae TaxID=506594 RepID=A0ABP8JB89_9MICO
MNDYRVVFGRDSLSQLDDLYDYIADADSPDTALRFTNAIVDFCEGLGDFPSVVPNAMTSDRGSARSATEDEW